MWALFIADALLVLVVYSLLEPGELYAVSRDGVEGGLSRFLTHLNFPLALAALPLILLALDALPRRAWLVGGPALALSAFVAIPGVVDPDDLDARAINLVPATGVVLTLGLTIAATRRVGAELSPWTPGDRWRVAASAIALVASLPWLAAEAGFHLPGGVFLTDEAYAEPGKPPTAAVHLGHHHGLAGTLFFLAALVLSRRAPRGLGRLYAVLVGLMLAYGAANLVQDLWHEQVVKRGWTDWDVPSALVPGASATWGVVVAATVALYVLGFARAREAPEPR